MIEEKKGVKSTHPQYDEYAPRWVLTKNVVKSHVKDYIKDVEDVSGSTEMMSPLPLNATDEEKDRHL